MTLDEFNKSADTTFETKIVEGKTIIDTPMGVDGVSAWTMVRMIECGVPLMRNWLEDGTEVFQIKEC